MPPAKRKPVPATVGLSVDVGGACVSVDGVPWNDAERVMVALVAMMDAVQGQCPSLRHVVDVVHGGSPIEVSDGDGARRAVGF